MAFRSPIREQEWRNRVRPDLHKWKTNFDHTRSQIPRSELQQISHSDSTNPEFPSPESGTSYGLPSSSPLPAPSEGRRVHTRSQTSCAPSEIRPRSQSPDSSGSDADQAAGHKRRISQVTPSPSARRSSRQQKTGHNQDDHHRRRAAQFCTQRCLLGLQTGNVLDESCPNVGHHRRSKNHPTQHYLGQGHDTFTEKPIGQEHRSLHTPRWLRLIRRPVQTYLHGIWLHGIGKGTTSGLWKEVSREAQVYRVLRKAQGSAVPVFLGTIDLAKMYFLHGAGQIRHMLVMGWGGESTATMELTQWLRLEIHKSNKEITALGIIHEELRRDNVLWSEELGRALIIDFHRSTLRCRPALQRPGAAKDDDYVKQRQEMKNVFVSLDNGIFF